jgi:hypothetical protein
VVVKSKFIDWLHGSAAYLSHIERRTVTVEDFIGRIIANAWRDDPGRAAAKMGDAGTGPAATFNGSGWERT